VTGLRGEGSMTLNLQRGVDGMELREEVSTQHFMAECNEDALQKRWRVKRH
jgi:hypothetical protein